MRWTIRPLIPFYSERTVRKFLWWPVTIGNEARWLERATIKQEFGRDTKTYRERWINIAWDD